MKMKACLFGVWLAMALGLTGTEVLGQEQGGEAAKASDQEKEKGEGKGNPGSEKQQLEKEFEKRMTGAVMEGRWVLVKEGKMGEEKEERYAIQRVGKIADDKWLIYARVQYGEKDVAVPIPVDVKWAGDTPVISITDLTIPGLGTYTARVLIYKDSYAGTWSGPGVSGMLHGLIRTED